MSEESDYKVLCEPEGYDVWCRAMTLLNPELDSVPLNIREGIIIMMRAFYGSNYFGKRGDNIILESGFSLDGRVDAFLSFLYCMERGLKSEDGRVPFLQSEDIMLLKSGIASTDYEDAGVDISPETLAKLAINLLKKRGTRPSKDARGRKVWRVEPLVECLRRGMRRAWGSKRALDALEGVSALTIPIVVQWLVLAMYRNNLASAS